MRFYIKQNYKYNYKVLNLKSSYINNLIILKLIIILNNFFLYKKFMEFMEGDEKKKYFQEKVNNIFK